MSGGRWRCARFASGVQAKNDLDSKKVKLAKLRGTPGLKVGEGRRMPCGRSRASAAQGLVAIIALPPLDDALRAQEQKISEAEQEVADAEQRVRDTKIAFDQVADLMTEELNRFQKQRAADMRTLLQEFALAQARAAADNAKAWGSLLSDIQAQQQQGPVVTD